MSDPLTKHLEGMEKKAAKKTKPRKPVKTAGDALPGDEIEVTLRFKVMWDRRQWGMHCLLVWGGKRTQEVLVLPREVEASLV